MATFALAGTGSLVCGAATVMAVGGFLTPSVTVCRLVRRLSAVAAASPDLVREPALCLEDKSSMTLVLREGLVRSLLASPRRVPSFKVTCSSIVVISLALRPGPATSCSGWVGCSGGPRAGVCAFSASLCWLLGAWARVAVTFFPNGSWALKGRILCLSWLGVGAGDASRLLALRESPSGRRLRPQRWPGVRPVRHHRRGRRLWRRPGRRR